MTRAIEPNQSEEVLVAASERAAGRALPPQLTALTERHLTRLEALVETMRDAGIEEDLVRHSVHEIIDSYERCLVDALIRMSEETS